MYSHKELLEPAEKVEDITAEMLRKRYKWAKTMLGLASVQEFPPEVFECMVEDGWVGLERGIPISNTVCKGIFTMENGRRAHIDLGALSLPLLTYNIQINTYSFPAVTFPLTGVVQARVVLFATGKIVITGFICPSEMYYSIEFVRGLLERCGYHGIRYNPHELPVENMVSRLCMPAPVKKELFRAIHPAADCSSDFPGMFVHFVRSNANGPDRNWTVLVFDGDLCVFVGWRTRQERDALYYLISPMLYLSTELKRDGKHELHPLYQYMQARIRNLRE